MQPENQFHESEWPHYKLRTQGDVLYVSLIRLLFKEAIPWKHYATAILRYRATTLSTISIIKFRKTQYALSYLNGQGTCVALVIHEWSIFEIVFKHYYLHRTKYVYNKFRLMGHLFENDVFFVNTMLSLSPRCASKRCDNIVNFNMTRIEDGTKTKTREIFDSYMLSNRIRICHFSTQNVFPWRSTGHKALHGKMNSSFIWASRTNKLWL